MRVRAVAIRHSSGLLRSAFVGAVLYSIVTIATPSAPAASTTVQASVPSATVLDATGCTGSDLSLGPVLTGSTMVTPTGCDISFGASNGATTLRAVQADGSGTALTTFASVAVMHQGAPDLYGAAARSATEAWLVGEPRKPGDPTPLAHTTDGGATWVSQGSCVAGASLRAVDHVSATTVVAVGAGSVICRSTDSGSTWSQVASPVASNWRTVEIMSTGEGWLAGSDGRVAHTVDGGATWSNLPRPSNNWDIYDISVATSSKLYGAVRDYSTSPPGALAVTSSDGGSTWTPYLIGNTQPSGWALSVASVDADTAVVGSSYGGYRTTDGGATWSQVTIRNFICTVAFDATTVVGYYGSGVPVYRSTDAGATWSAAAVSPATTGQVRGCAAGSATAGFVAGYNDQRLVTTDAGQNHVVSPSPARDLRAVGAWSASRFIAVGDDGAARYTIDGGTSMVLTTTGTAQHLKDVEFTSASRAVAVGTGGVIRRTLDGGATWSGSASGTASAMYGIERADHGRMYAVGAGGTVISSDDDGATWRARTSPTSQALNDVATVAWDELWVVSAAGEIFRSSDSGDTWTSQVSGTALPIISIDAIDAQTAIATTAVDGTVTARILRTTDGGTTWNVAMGATGEYYYDVGYLDRQRVVVAGNAKYRRSQDGGVTWTSYSTGLSNIFAVAQLDPNSFVLAGQGDAVASVTPGPSFADYDPGSVDFSMSSSVFGACLQSATGIATTVWPVAGVGNCTSTNVGVWRGIAAVDSDPSAAIATTATGATGGAVFRFGAKPGATQAPGDYVAAIRFELTAP